MAIKRNELYVTKKMVVPYKDQHICKKMQIASMFNNIAAQYDFLNHFLSFGIDKYWRKKAVELLNENKPKKILDIATGTGCFTFEASKLNPEKIIGIDISEEMLKIGMKKVKSKKMEHIIGLSIGDSERLHFEDHYFDAATIGFGARNFENLNSGLAEIFRVLKPGGKAIFLEFSKPSAFPVKQLYYVYFNTILPLLGRFFSKDRSAYHYLPESVSFFPEKEHFIYKMQNMGFVNTGYRPLTFGITSVYFGQKPVTAYKSA